MNIVVVGLSHKTAPVEVREKLSIPEAKLEEAIHHLSSYPHIEEVAIISTCNRLEIYAVIRETEQGVREITQFLIRCQSNSSLSTAATFIHFAASGCGAASAASRRRVRKFGVGRRTDFSAG